MKQKGETQLGNVAKFYKMGTTCIDAVFNLTEVVCVCWGAGRAGPICTRFVFGSNVSIKFLLVISMLIESLRS